MFLPFNIGLKSCLLKIRGVKVLYTLLNLPVVIIIQWFYRSFVVKNWFLKIKSVLPYRMTKKLALCLSKQLAKYKGVELNMKREHTRNDYEFE